jgi:peptidoglycan/LPS O-acetylase OafA/YrhL
MMLLLSLFWLLIGLFIGALAIAAKLPPATQRYQKRLSMLVAGALAALIGGWLGTWVFGSLFGTATALWIAVAGIVVTGVIQLLKNASASNTPEAPPNT